MDWRKLRKFLADKYNVSKAYMFIGYVPEFNDMYDFLHDAGFAIVLKPTFDISRPPREVVAKPMPNGEEEDKKPVKGNVDAELVLWAVKEMKNYDKAVIISGDGDFYSLVEYLDQQGKLLKLMPPNVHFSSLYRPYEKYIDHLGNYRRELAYHDRKPRKIPQK